MLVRAITKVIDGAKKGEKDKKKPHKFQNYKQPHFKLQRNERLLVYFKTVICGGDDRLTKQRLVELLSNRYPAGHTDRDGVYHPSIADAMVRQLWVFLDNTGSDLKFDMFCDKFEKFMN